MEPRRPNKLRIGSLSWDVHYLDQKQWQADESLDDGNGNGGETHAWDHTLWVATEHPTGVLDDHYVKEVLVHEVLHACAEINGTNQAVRSVESEDIEETFISGVAVTLTGVLRDNPSFALWLIEK